MGSGAYGMTWRSVVQAANVDDAANAPTADTNRRRVINAVIEHIFLHRQFLAFRGPLKAHGV